MKNLPLHISFKWRKVKKMESGFSGNEDGFALKQHFIGELILQLVFIM